MPPDEAYPRAMAAAKRAIAVDDSLSGAHRSLAFADFYWSWDVAGAQREFKRALALDPKSAIAHHWYATFLVHLGRSPESLEEIEKAQKLDPMSTPILADKGLILFYDGQTEQAVALLKQLETTEPDFLSHTITWRSFILCKAIAGNTWRSPGRAPRCSTTSSASPLSQPARRASPVPDRAAC
jgi:Tfp pilus assembly protein PilF